MVVRASKSVVSPTPEQTAILNSVGGRVRINARAGTGKTTTLRLLAQRLIGKSEKGLYLVYNNRSCKDARAKLRGVPGLSVSTVHAFALGSVPSEFKAIRTCTHTGSPRPEDFLAEYEPLGEARESLAVLTARFSEYFLNSVHATLDVGAEQFARDELAGALQGQFHAHRGRIVATLRSRMVLWRDGAEGCPHDFYLKMAHKKRWLAKRLEHFGVLLVDEAQDLSPVMVDCVGQFKGRTFVVGDSHQQIYDFRYAVDALTHLPHDEEHDLSLSFRFGREIAGLASSFIAAAVKEQSFRIDGNPKLHSAVVVSDVGPTKMPPGSAIIARTNTCLFSEAEPLLLAGREFVFTRDLRRILDRAMSVYGVWSGQRRLVKDGLLRSFPDVEAMEEHAKAVDDRELQLLIHFVERQRDRAPSLLLRLQQVPMTDECPPDAVTLTTVHGAKGLEFDEVKLCSDIFAKLKTAMTKNHAELHAEVNLTYVAITRARLKLYLPEEARQLPIDWPPGRSAKVTEAPTRGGQLSRSTTRSSASASSEKAAVRPAQTGASCAYPAGSSVNVKGYGRGVVVEAAGQNRRVRLDKTSAEIWIGVSRLDQ